MTSALSFPRALVIAAALSFPALATPALADDDQLIGNIVSSEPEASEDCDALRDSLQSNSDNGSLNAQQRRELRDKGC